jgi:hypothetical protein
MIAKSAGQIAEQNSPKALARIRRARIEPRINNSWASASPATYQRFVLKNFGPQPS